MTHFEVHKFTDDRWLLDAVYDDQGTAISDARGLMARARALAAVRVLKVEEHDEGFVEWIVYTRDPAVALGGLLTIVFQKLEPRDPWIFNRPEAQQPRAIANPWTGETSR
jgi:hypothetical protein